MEIDSNPFSGETLAEIVMANQHDLDEAYKAAAKAQGAWESGFAGAAGGHHVAALALIIVCIGSFFGDGKGFFISRAWRQPR